MSKLLNIKTEDGYCFLELNRPEKRNALNPDLLGELYSFFKKDSSDCKGVILSGKGKSFCSGADLKWLQDEAVFNQKELEKLFLLFEAMVNYPRPIVAKAQGSTVGGGLGLLACSDVVIAEKGASFRFSETSLGLVPAIISPFILRKIGLSLAQFLMLTADRFSAQRAYEIGLVHFTGEEPQCSEFLNKIISNFKELDPTALSQTKKLLNSIYSSPLSEVKTDCVNIISEARKSDFVRKKISELFKK